jgi:ketosteroid isomerase-like protein
MSLEDENRALVARALNLLAQIEQPGKTREYLDLFSDDMTWWIAGDVVGGQMDRAQYAAMIENIPAVLSAPFVFTVTGWTCQGDRVAVEASGKTVLKDGRSYENLLHLLYIVRGGKIVAGKEYLDTARSAAAFMPSRD